MQDVVALGRRQEFAGGGGQSRIKEVAGGRVFSCNPFIRFLTSSQTHFVSPAEKQRIHFLPFFTSRLILHILLRFTICLLNSVPFYQSGAFP